MLCQSVQSAESSSAIRRSEGMLKGADQATKTGLLMNYLKTSVNYT